MKSFQRRWEGLEITIITVIVLLLLLLEEEPPLPAEPEEGT